MLTLEKSNIHKAMLSTRLTMTPKIYLKHIEQNGYFHAIVCNGIATINYSPYGSPSKFILDNKNYAFILKDNDSVLFDSSDIAALIADKHPANISFSFL